jgi:hypothetical protein
MGVVDSIKPLLSRPGGISFAFTEGHVNSQNHNNLVKMSLNTYRATKTKDQAFQDSHVSPGHSEKNVEHAETAEKVIPHGSDRVTEEPEGEYHFTIGQFFAMAVRIKLISSFRDVSPLWSISHTDTPVGDAVGIHGGGILDPDDFCHSHNNQQGHW